MTMAYRNDYDTIEHPLIDWKIKVLTYIFAIIKINFFAIKNSVRSGNPGS